VSPRPDSRPTTEATPAGARGVARDPYGAEDGCTTIDQAVGALDRVALRDAWPVVLGIVPFGLLIGVTIGHSGVGAGLGLGSAALFFGGSAHLAALTLLQAGAGPVAVLACVIVVNARLALYGAALQSRFRDQPAWFRWSAPHLLVDQTYAIASAKPELAHPARFRRYWLTAGTAIGVCWLASHVVSMALGPVVPRHPAMEITAPAIFVALLVPQLRTGPALLAAAVAALVAGATSALPQGLAPVLGALAGLAAAAFVDRSDPAQAK
jgi:predicted branched-subunit amino acid permease